MEAINSFNNGMNSDVSKLVHSKDSYLQALNFRPQTELGESNGALVNIKGNTCAVTFPDLQAVYKIKPVITNAAVGGNTATITINGQTTANITVNASTKGLTIYNALKALNNCYQTTNGAPATATFAVAYQDDYVIIYQQPVYQTCSSTASVAPTITITPSGGAVNLLKFEDRLGALWTVQSTAGTFHYLVASSFSKDLIIIGHTFILDDIYLFTAPNDPAYGQTNGVPASDSNTFPGHIWKLNFDETLNISTLTLLYSAALDFTKYFPIAPSAATGRYESDPIQRIYWSDFYNKIRTVNAANAQLMAVNPKLIALIPSVGFDIPILKDIIGGNLNVGSYELCYRLTQNLGAVTNYSAISNIVNLTNGTFGTWTSTEGNPPGTNSNKGIRWTLSNLDTSYDNVEIVALFRDTQTNLPSVWSVFKTAIPLSGTLDYDLVDFQNATEIDLLTFLTLASTFTHAKTVDTKDNRLWWGNVKVKTGDLNYDARAFRAKTSGGNDVYLFNNGIQAVYTLAQAEALAETEDTINRYYDPTTGNHDANACYFQPGTALLGGKGTNISYQFKTLEFQLNNMYGTGTGDAVGNISGDVPYRYTNAGSPSSRVLITSTNDSPNQFYNFSSSPDSMKFPYRSSLLRGFQHEEIYRFGIQFFDLEGNPYFVKWIGDIKFPAYGDSNPTGPTGDFRMSYNPGGVGPGINGQALAIEFIIDVTSIQDQISGYKIVRVERPDNEKTILGCGIMTPTYIHDGTDVSNGDSGNAYMPANFLGYRELFPPVALRAGQSMYPWPSSYACDQLNADSTATHLDAKAAKVKTFDSFDIELNGGLTYISGDRLFLRSKLSPRNYRGTAGQGFIKSDTFGGVSNNNDWLTNDNVDGTTNGPFWNNHVTPGLGALDGSGTHYQTGFDTGEQPYYLHMYEDNTVFVGTATANAISAANYIRTLSGAEYVLLNNSSAPLTSGVTYNNWGRAYATNNPVINTPIGNFGANDKTCYGARTLVCDLNTAGYYEDSAPYGCVMAANNKLIALYYRPKPNQYGGADYNARALSEYIACGSYIPIKRNNKTLANNVTLTQLVYGGDVYQSYWDHQKAIKSAGASQVTYNYYPQGVATGKSAEIGYLAGANVSNGTYQVSVTYFFPCTTYNNAEVLYGDHINTQLTVNTYANEDADLCERYHTNERDVVIYYPKPVNFVTTDTWVNRIVYSEVKTNNELQDNWQAYKANNFYDVEGNYGPINCVMALKQKLYFLQERGLGFLYINPITAITGSSGLQVTLGKGATVERHDYISLDVGTKHQWSVSKSQSNMTWLDIRSKKIFLFNGESVSAISDNLGQRNFVIKRCHPNLLANDNPIIYKGIHSTFDYFNNEFLYTFINGRNVGAQENVTENYTLAYSEAIDKFSSMYSFVPQIYLNNNRYLFSVDPLRDKTTTALSIYLHNFGNYATFYGTLFPSTIKTIVNDNPTYSKVFDNISFLTESIKDNVEWIDDYVIPNSNISFITSDNVNYLDDTFKRARFYNDYQNTDFISLVPTLPNNTIRRVEQSWNLQIPRNKFNYDVFNIDTKSLFDPTALTKTSFGERIRDKYVIVDLEYDNTLNNRFIVNMLKTTYRISDR